MGEDLSIVTQALGVGSPDELHFFVVHSLVLILIIKSGEEPSIEAHLSKETSISVGVTEGVDLPADARFHTELLLEEFHADHVVVDHVVVDRAGLVVHGPAAVDELQLAVLHQGLHRLLHVVGLAVPPHSEEFDLHLRELPLRVINQSVHNSSDLHFYVRPLGAPVGSVEVLVDSLQPPDVVVRVRDDMDSQLLSSSKLVSYDLSLVMMELPMIHGNAGSCH
mmetsp:Transcript_521/g.550  ORF Transcript_521/g.550 Transcript_521/m.550 type:complete len:222 (-) Transcript_521:59-724(-)